MEPTIVTPLAGLVLAGGASTRMGTDKALLLFEGQPLITRAAERVAAVASPVLVAIGRPGRLGPIGLQEVGDAVPNCGPLGGLVAGIQASPHMLAAAVAVDMPYLSPHLLAFLASLHDSVDVVAPISEKGLEPLHAVYSRSALPAMHIALRERRYGLRDLLSQLRLRQVAPAEWAHLDIDPRFAFNVNRPEDLESQV